MNKVYVSAYRDSSKSWRKEGSAEEVFKKVIALPKEESVTKLRIKWVKENISTLWDGGLVERKKPPYKILDIGGGTGIFAYEFQDKEWKGHIIDPSEGNEFITKKLKIPLMREFYSPNKFKTKFDLVSMIYILEHVLDPISFLRQVRRDMKNNSFLFIEVPDENNFKFRKPINDVARDIFHSEHLWMFGPKTLHWLLEQCGFELFALKRLKTKRDHFALMALAAKK